MTDDIPKIPDDQPQEVPDWVARNAAGDPIKNKDGSWRKKPGRASQSAAKAPQSAGTAVIEATHAPRQQALTENLSPDDLAPPGGSLQSVSLRQFYFWVGLADTSPVESITLGTSRFTKNQELVRKGANGTQRIPVKGTIAKMSRDDFDLMVTNMRHTVFRFHSPEGTEEKFTDASGAEGLRPRRGYPITIPTEQFIKDREAEGRGYRPYRAGRHDEPVINHIWCVPCDDQGKPMRGQTVPDTVSVTGLSWPLLN